MPSEDELYRKTIQKIKRDRVLKFIAPIVALAFPICFWLGGTRADGGLYEPFKYLFIGAIILVFVVPAVYNFFANFYAKPAQNLADGKICAELKELENERVNLVAAVKKASFIALIVGVCAGAAIAYFLEWIFGAALGGISYVVTSNLLTASKRREFRANFKRLVTENIVKKHGLNYEKDRGLGLDDFFVIYDCAVDEWSSEDLAQGEIEGVRVKFSDFYAAKKVKAPKPSCSFAACFLTRVLTKN